MANGKHVVNAFVYRKVFVCRCRREGESERGSKRYEERCNHNSHFPVRQWSERDLRRAPIRPVVFVPDANVVYCVHPAAHKHKMSQCSQ